MYHNLGVQKNFISTIRYRTAEAYDILEGKSRIILIISTIRDLPSDISYAPAFDLANVIMNWDGYIEFERLDRGTNVSI